MNSCKVGGFLGGPWMMKRELKKLEQQYEQDRSQLVSADLAESERAEKLSRLEADFIAQKAQISDRWKALT